MKKGLGANAYGMKLFHGVHVPRMMGQKTQVMSFHLYANKCHWCGTCVHSAYTYIALKCIAIPAENEPYLMNPEYH
jgi:ferredoxin